MALIRFSKPEKDAITQKIQEYFSTELDQKIGTFEAGFLLEFFAEQIGPYFYNKGLQDSQVLLKKRMDEITSAIDSLEKPTDARR